MTSISGVWRFFWDRVILRYNEAVCYLESGNDSLKTMDKTEDYGNLKSSKIPYCLN